ncbi:MAG: hypothetical protein RL226_582 [Bacteroidota bacterium]|jgi:ComEC/Rec2-related protein
MQHYIYNLPLVRPFLCLALGIICQSSLPAFHPPYWLIAFIVLATISHFHPKSALRFPWLSGLLLWISFLLFGMTLTFYAVPAERNAGIVEGKIRLTRVNQYSKGFCTGEGIMLNPSQKPLRTLFTLSDSSVSPRVGDFLEFTGVLTSIQAPTNPFEFNASDYYAARSVHHTLQIRKLISCQSNTDVPSGIQFIGEEHIRNQLQFVSNDRLRGLLFAMITGDKSDLDAEIRSNFAVSGIMHLLAVSGLHVGLIGWLPLVLMKRLPPRSRFRIPLAIVGALIVWAFVFFTGAGASATRAGFMFTLALIALLLRVRTSLLNSLCAAGIIILIMSPLTLFDVGFQLSFSAVAGIGLMSRPIMELISGSSSIIQKAWSGVAVSTAAQASTSPFSLYHFGTFPVYFLPANLIAVPLGTFMMYGLLLLLVPLPFPEYHKIIGAVLDFTGNLLLFVADFIARLPMAQIVTSEWHLVNSGLLMITVLYLFNQRLNVVRFVRVCALLILALTLLRKHNHSHLVLFDTNRFTIGIATSKGPMLIANAHKSPFECRSWMERTQATPFLLNKDTLVCYDGSVIFRKGKALGCNHALLNPANSQKKRPVTILVQDAKGYHISYGGWHRYKENGTPACIIEASSFGRDHESFDQHIVPTDRTP